MLSHSQRLVLRAAAGRSTRNTAARFQQRGVVQNNRLLQQQYQPQFHHQQQHDRVILRLLSVTKQEEASNNNESVDNESKNTASKNDNKESLEDTVKRMKKESKSKNADGGDDGFDPQIDGFLRKATETWSAFTEEVGKTWGELLKAGERKDINKKIAVNHPHDTVEGDAEYTGSVEIMVIDESEHLTAWERMQKRLTEAPIISDILLKTDEVYTKSGAKKMKQKVDHLSEDAREAWETSQNPWVYRISSVYETVTAETPESIAVAELRKLDPEFTLEDWRQDVVEHTLPKIMEWFLLGKINQLKPWLGEGVFKRIAAEITARKQEGVQIDTHVLGIMNSEILAIEVSFM